MSNVYLVSKTEQTSYKEYIFDFVYLAQDKGWRLVGEAIMTYINTFSEQ